MEGRRMCEINLLRDKCVRCVRKFAAVRLTVRVFPFYYDPAGLDVTEGSIVIVPYNDREELGEVGALEMRCDPYFQRLLYPPIIRLAESEEIKLWEEHRQREKEALQFCKEKAKEHGLVMKISDVCIDKRHRKVTFHFSAPKRIDFRELVKDLAQHFKSRIELWQVGARDEAQKIDGYGVCGRRLCCAAFINKFVPISVKMAREQDLLIAPSKISGVCGRLMCCLAYEQGLYQELGKDAPPIGAIARTTELEAEIIDRNLLMQLYILEDEQGKRYVVKRDEILEVKIPEDIEKIQRELKQIKEEVAEEALPPDDTEENANL